MNRWKTLTLLFLLITVPASSVTAQTETSNTFITPDMPQWAKDMRRWEIVAFGTIPFTMFFSTFAMDMFRWNKANGMEFTSEGRRYAPWPMKSAGGIVMTSREQETVFIMAAGMSVAIAFADFAIVKIKRARARRRAEALPVGTTIIVRTPLEEPEGQDDTETDENS
jgi:hypothetical protein